MKKEDLTALGLTEDQIAGVQKLNGLDITAEQKKTSKAETERDTYKGQLDNANNTLKEFEGINVKDLQGKIETLTNDLANKDKEIAAKLAERDFNDKINAKITAAGGRSAKAIMAMLDIEALKASKNQDADIDAAITASKTDNAWMYGTNEPINTPTGPTTSGGTTNKPLDQMSFEEYKAYRTGK